MNTKKMLLACLAAFVVTFLLSGLWHIVLLGDFYKANDVALARAEPNMLFVILGQLILTFLMAVVYPMGYKGGSPVKEGFRFGAIIGLIWLLPWSVMMHGLWNYPLAGVIVDSAWHVVEEGVGGIVIGLVYGTSKK
ncbi:MAG: hypothetical protein A2455_07340 [Ignavibacteria bacterium RIFOXYC2_FULL_35_16]|nr:MAG: hypothetical protein A2X60_07350 [Ignavibacteria bacterium GWF2_35_20]OGU84523.1 MAG: hypothetical protein A3K31_08855 [Ignavibacteria bacterium RIFOXYA12_FULL_35_25]OGU92047.1 MAG: hypothetical protein A2492_01315 [Ignavibacteria bacterium RIFOXYC12_FULL_35_11]OGU95647.1 MAG: hypothetical protein A2347_00415 [Ignavibacteria bacterium RIFOXYB12_FULL_35_14]OGU99101.1 MAG: hypothetical protein A2455_07340 [Ignavibacteria bacterium RIFOXYC2_FULL_35_16]OGV33014.1 MAG: hypothetical protein 